MAKVDYKPKGFHSIVPYLTVKGAEVLTKEEIEQRVAKLAK